MRYVQPEETGQVRPQQERGVQGPAGGGVRGSGAGSQAAGSHRCLRAAEIEQGTHLSNSMLNSLEADFSPRFNKFLCFFW